MNNIPAGLQGYDFTWSTCSFEHCGTLELWLRFLERQMECLKPGGIAVHTTEYDHTGSCQIDNWPTVLYTQADIRELRNQLATNGMELLAPSFQQSGYFIDGYIDIPPYPLSADFDHAFFQADGSPSDSSIPQLNLSIDGFKATSYALIVRRL
jgi:hypothetical protein